MCLCCVLVSGWSLNEEFGLEFKLSCREQNGLQDKKKNIYIYIGRKGNEKKEKEIEDMWSQCRKGRSLF